MPHRPIPMDRSERAKEALNGVLARATPQQPQELDPELLQTKLDAQAYWQDCERELAAEERARLERDAARQRRDKVENHITEGLEVLSAIAAGAMATWRTENGRNLGEPLNGLIGIASKAASVANFDSRPARVAARAGKVFLHSQISMSVRNSIEENK